MKKRLIVAAIFLPIVFSVLFILPPVFLSIMLAFICAVSAIELCKAIGATNNFRIRVYIVKAAIYIPLATYIGSAHLGFFPSRFVAWIVRVIYITEPIAVAIIFLTVLLFIEAIKQYKTKSQLPFATLISIIFAAVIMPYMLTTLLDLRLIGAQDISSLPYYIIPPKTQLGRYLVLVPIICAFLTDAGAYFAGLLFGKKKAFPKISPNKTVAGYIGGLLTGIITVTLYAFIVNHYSPYFLNPLFMAFLGLIGAAATQLGDLAFSLIKREYDVKDFGKILPGHGGMLDRFDSLFIAAPVLYIFFTILPIH